MNIVLFDINTELVKAWKSIFFDYASTVEIAEMSLETLIERDKFDCLVSPANSFGIMDGGIDLPIRRAFPEVQAEVTQVIARNWQGYMPVGDCSLAKTGDDRHPWLAIVPTMPWPMPIPSFWVYNSMRGLFAELHRCHTSHHSPHVRRLAIPGMGTATGAVPPGEAARMMMLAYKHSLEGKAFSEWEDASKMIEELTP